MTEAPSLNTEMKAAFDQHVLFEFHRDLDGTLSTMIDDPWYEIFPHGLRLEGAAAVRAWYGRMFDRVIPRIVDIMKVEDRSVAVGAEHLVVEQRTNMVMPDDSIEMCNALSVVVFSNNKVAGERFYMDDGYRAIFELVIDDEFRSLPGVHSMWPNRTF